MRITIIYFIFASLLLTISFVIFRIIVRRDYKRKGRLTLLSTMLESIIWVPYFSFPYIYNPLDWGWFWSYEVQVSPVISVIGVISIVVGLASTIISVAYLGLRRSLGQEVNILRESGLYRVTRNPQIVACVPLVVGYVLLIPSWYALGWLILYAAMSHMMVVTEEEHLQNIHGEKYVQYCKRVPRYLDFPSKSN